MAATQLPEELHEIIARSLASAKELQTHISNFNGTLTDENGLLTALIQAHTAHLVNHSAIIRHVVAAYGNESSTGALKSVVAAGARMIGDTRQLQEYLIGLRVQKDRGAHRPTTPAPAPRDYRAPTVEVSENEADVIPTNGSNDISPPPPSGRNGTPVKSKRKKDKTVPTVEADALRSSPKRRLRDEDELSTQAMVKRTKPSPAPTKYAKRKSDVSMLDVEEEVDDDEVEPLGKRQKQQHEQKQAGHTLPAVQVEYEDITAEVDARMQQTEQRKKREKKQELGVVDKRKRQSIDSVEVELQREEVDEAEKPSRKRKKKKHSGLLQV